MFAEEWRKKEEKKQGGKKSNALCLFKEMLQFFF